MNRVLDRAARIQELILAGGKDGSLREPGALTELDQTMAIDPEEHFVYQEAQAHAHAGGRLSSEEAMVVYRALGEVMSSENGGWQPHVDTSLKVAITQLMMELLVPGAVT